MSEQIVQNPCAFLRLQEDGNWCVVIVGNTERTPPESGAAEVITYGFFPDRIKADRWIGEIIGPMEQTYCAPEWTN